MFIDLGVHTHTLESAIVSSRVSSSPHHAAALFNYNTGELIHLQACPQVHEVELAIVVRNKKLLTVSKQLLLLLP
jgi:hypothetical protein